MFPMQKEQAIVQIQASSCRDIYTMCKYKCQNTLTHSVVLSQNSIAVF